MKKIIYLSDFIEGKPVIAAVRYSEIMEYLTKQYDLTVINDIKYGKYKSKFVKTNYKFKSISNMYNKKWDTKEIKRTGFIERNLRKNKYILSLWRNLSHSKYIFNFKNRKLYRDIYKYINENNIRIIFATVPDIYVLYIAEKIKRKFPEVIFILEIRDIINNNIEEGNAKYQNRKGENILLKIADGIIALSQGIYENYYKRYKSKNIKVIKNGYNTDDFKDCSSKVINVKDSKCLILSYVGSIYSGRNVRRFLKSLIKLNSKLSVNITFNIVGFLDGNALDDIFSLKDQLEGNNIKINTIGTVPHSEAIKYLKCADIAVIFTHEIGSEYAIPGKVFEYIGSCTRIIAVTRDKELVNLVHGKYGECASHNVEDIVEKLLKTMNTTYCFDDRFRFSRKIQAQSIMNFIENTINISQN